MTSDDVLVLAWLLLAHLVADFLLQTDRVVADKFGRGRQAWRGLGMHGAAVALCLVPVALAFGVPGLGLLVAVTLGHVAIDRWKTVATKRAEARATPAAGTPTDPDVPEALGPAWTPVPAMLFVLDQAFHAALIVGAWLVFVAPSAPTAEWTAVVDRLMGGFPREDFHRAAGLIAIGASLLIVNVRAGAFFVATLVRPAERGGAPRRGASEPPPPEPPLPAAWRLRFGRFSAVAEPTPAASVAAPGAVTPVTEVGHASPIRIGATIGILERLLIVIFVLSGAVAAIGFVVAAKTLARFKQLDDRDFAEYYLLGTLASVSVGLGSALLAQAALSSLVL